MFSFLCDFFREKEIDCFGMVPLDQCKIVRPYLLDRHGIEKTGTVCIFAVPYYTKFCDDSSRNLSSYAVSKDYHLFFKIIFEELIPSLKKRFPTHCFAGFADHSPIDEVNAAARAGLGVIGKNNLLLTEKYSSYVFLGEIITDAEFSCHAQPLAFCKECDICKKNCPLVKDGVCLSALTQKKGALSDAEMQIILKNESIWGCDLCQETCPYTVQAKYRGSLYTPISFFEQAPIPYLCKETVSAMSEENFSERAYSWRGRDTILRNLNLTEENKESKGDHKC